MEQKTSLAGGTNNGTSSVTESHIVTVKADYVTTEIPEGLIEKIGQESEGSVIMIEGLADKPIFISRREPCGKFFNGSFFLDPQFLFGTVVNEPQVMDRLKEIQKNNSNDLISCVSGYLDTNPSFSFENILPLIPSLVPLTESITLSAVVVYSRIATSSTITDTYMIPTRYMTSTIRFPKVTKDTIKKEPKFFPLLGKLCVLWRSKDSKTNESGVENPYSKLF